MLDRPDYTFDRSARVARTVVFDQPPGTLVFDVTDPDDDDNGPGTYAYPDRRTASTPAPSTSGDFAVYDAGPTVVFQLRTRDLTPTFGSPLGAQLVDVYVHVPGAQRTRTAASFPERRYSIAARGPGAACIEVQGFGQRFVDAGESTLGTVGIRGNAISRNITFAVPKAALGAPRRRAGASPWSSPARTASAPTRRAASSPRRRASSSACARRRAPIRTARPTRRGPEGRRRP